MSDMSCPWCEADLVLRVVDDEQTCPECGTTWSYEDEAAEIELLIAA
jgi:Zn-finger nucleic acid-binding protein